MTNFRSSSARANAPSFPIAVAMCAVRSALRPFLNNHDPGFTALLEMPAGIDSLFYHQAASDLLATGPQYDEYGQDILYVARIDQVEMTNSLRKILGAKRVVLLCYSLDKLDADLRFVADIEVVLKRPSPAHFLGAARMSGVVGMTREDADYLASLDFDRVKVAINGHRPLRSAIGRLRRASMAEAAKRSRSPADNAEPQKTLREMSGYGEAAAWGIQLADDIAAWKAGDIPWADVDRGVVLHGKPGTGKTSYGRLLASTCGVPIIEASSARWQSRGHLGDMLGAMRKAFETATNSAPCILFVDELDAFGDRSSNTSSDNSDYKRQVINAFLECLDPPGGRPGVVVVGATNAPEAIDPALLRPGRLERLIAIPLPDAETRVAILKHHLREMPPPSDLRQFVELTAGYAGASIEMLAREARRRARREGRPIREQDLFDALPPSRSLDNQELRRVAVHEAGHAILAVVATTDELVAVVVNRRVQLAEAVSSLGHIEYTMHPNVVETEQTLSARIDVLLAGIAAERIVYGGHSTSGGGARSSDLHIATERATALEGQFGYGESLSLDLGSGTSALETMRARDPGLRRAVETRLKASLARTEAILCDYRLELDQLVDQLVMRGQVSGLEVRTLVSARHGQLSRSLSSGGQGTLGQTSGNLRQEARP